MLVEHMAVEMGQTRGVEQKLVLKGHSFCLFPDQKRMVEQGLTGKEGML